MADVTEASEIATSTDELVCASCSKSEDQVSNQLRRCAKCQVTIYCSKDCQKADWKAHKKVCASLANDKATQDPAAGSGHACKGGHVPKVCSALVMLQGQPRKWFRGSEMDERDAALICAKIVPWLKYGQQSYVRKIYHTKSRAGLDSFSNNRATDWTVENDIKCKKMVAQAGGQLVGYIFNVMPFDWSTMLVNVSIKGNEGAGFDFGFLSTAPRNIRVLKGPSETCNYHPWDIMILRDCVTNMGSVDQLPYLADRRWDVLAVKCCEDYDSPWVVACVRDVGENDSDSTGAAVVRGTDTGCCSLAK